MKAHSNSSAGEPAVLAELIQQHSLDPLRKAARDLRLTEHLALALLERRDLPHQVIEDLTKNMAVMKHRRVINAVVIHPRTPRHVSLPIARRLYNFELMQITLLPTVTADLKMFAEEQLINRVETISAGERLALAKRGSTRIAAALLLDAEARVIEAALHNPYMTERWIVKAVLDDDAPQALIDALCRDPKWSLRREVRAALLRNEKTPLARVVAFAESMSSMALREILLHSRLPRNVKEYLQKILEQRPLGIKS